VWGQSLYYTGMERISSATNKFIFCKIDMNGNKLWQRYYGNSGERSAGHYIEPTPDGGFLLGGHRDTKSPWIIKTDSLGNIQWQRLFTSPLGGGVANILVSTDHYIYVTDREVKFEDGSNRYKKGWMAKLDLNNNLIWKKEY